MLRSAHRTGDAFSAVVRNANLVELLHFGHAVEHSPAVCADLLRVAGHVAYAALQLRRHQSAHFFRMIAAANRAGLQWTAESSCVSRG